MVQFATTVPSPTSILVVDDRADSRETLQALLTSEEYQIHAVATGLDALEILRQRPVDLVLCDVMMPGMDGFEVCRTIKEHRQWRYTPVVLITALDSPEDVVRGLESGADDFLTKPVQAAVLRARVRSVLRIRDAYARARPEPPDVEALWAKRRERIMSAADLSEREREVLSLLLLGRTFDDVASVLGISPRTARFHQDNALRKLGAESRLDLLRLFA